MADVVLRLDVLNDIIKYLISIGIPRNRHMAGQEHLPNSDSPDMQLMDRNHTFHLAEPALEPGGIDLAWRALHQNFNYVAQHPDCGEQYNHRENEGADEINDLPLRLIPDDSTSNHYTNALNGVPKHMQISTVYIDIASRLLSSFGTGLGALAISFILQEWFLSIMMLSSA
uniref:Uncharacterized protein n=1 Tax=Arundo donax TaxID=35708 RepID=A0A0A9D5J7_ARUDO